jgi:hypothetical protein
MSAVARERAKPKIYQVFMTSICLFGTAFASKQAKSSTVPYSENINLNLCLLGANQSESSIAATI